MKQPLRRNKLRGYTYEILLERKRVAIYSPEREDCVLYTPLGRIVMDADAVTQLADHIRKVRANYVKAGVVR